MFGLTLHVNEGQALTFLFGLECSGLLGSLQRADSLSDPACHLEGLDKGIEPCPYEVTWDNNRHVTGL